MPKARGRVEKKRQKKEGKGREEKKKWYVGVRELENERQIK